MSAVSTKPVGVPVQFARPSNWDDRQFRADYYAKMGPFFIPGTQSVDMFKLSRCIIPYPKTVFFKIERVVKHYLFWFIYPSEYRTKITIYFHTEAQGRAFCWHYRKDESLRANTNLCTFAYGAHVDLLVPKDKAEVSEEALSRITDQVKGELDKWGVNEKFQENLKVAEKPAELDSSNIPVSVSEPSEFLSSFEMLDKSINWTRLRKSVIDFPKIVKLSMAEQTLTFECSTDQDAFDLYELDCMNPLFPGLARVKQKPFDRFIGFTFAEQNKERVIAVLAALSKAKLVPNTLSHVK